MEHSRLLQKNSTSTLYVEYDDSLPISYRKLKFTDVIEEMIPENIDYNDVFWVSNVILPNEDCYVILIIYRDNEIIDYVVLRCGVPPLKVFYTDKNYKETDYHIGIVVNFERKDDIITINPIFKILNDLNFQY